MRTLYHSWLLAPCRKIRVMLQEKKLDFTLQLAHPWSAQEKLTPINPAGEVPILVDLDNTIVCHSTAICEYIEEAYPDAPLFGKNLLQRAETRRLIAWFDDKFNREVTQKIVYEKNFKRQHGLGNPDSRIIREGQVNARKHLDYISWLADRRNWLAGDHFSLADITAASHLSTLDYLGDINWDNHPLAKDWYTRVKSRPSFRALLEDAIPGLPSAPHYADLDF